MSVQTRSKLAISAELQLPVDAITETFGILAVKRAGKPVKATAAGMEAAGGVEELPSGPELLEHWFRHPRIGEGERRVLRVLIDAYPTPLTHAELCERTNYSPEASTIGVILSKLRKLGLVEPGQRRVPDSFMEAIRA